MHYMFVYNRSFSTQNYDKLLQSWSKLVLQPNVELSIWHTKYSKIAEKYRQYIIKPLTKQSNIYV